MINTDYDLIIIGGGPAGLTAGIYAARSKLKTLLIEKIATGGQILVSDFIENYPGFPDGLSGFELVQKMTEQTKKFDLKIEKDEVSSIDFFDKIKKIYLSNKTITSKTIIIATGASPRKLGVLREEQFIGKGISFCATCDGPFYKNLIVAAIGGGDTAVQESIYLTKFVKKIYLIHRRDKLRAAKILQERAFNNPKIEFLWDCTISKFNGKENLENIEVNNLKTDETRNIDVDGCFIWVGIQPNTQFLKDKINLDNNNFIITDANMKTSISGVFAAGDVRNTPLRQVSTSVGDGAISAMSAVHYIEKNYE